MQDLNLSIMWVPKTATFNIMCSQWAAPPKACLFFFDGEDLRQ